MLKIYRDFEDGATLTALGYDIVVRLTQAGNLDLPSGQLVACDLLHGIEAEPFARALPSGSYPITLIVAELRDETVVAYASVAIRDAPIRRWEVATTPGESELDEGGFHVSSDVACLMDLETADALLHLRQQADFDDERDELTDALLSQIYRSRKRGPGWGNISLPGSIGNIVALNPGHGSGFYTTRFGLDADGAIARIVMDFRVLDYRFPSFGGGARRRAS